MCSIVEGSFIEEENPVAEKATVCQKCKVDPPILTLRRKDVYCKSCFLVNCNHKFRSTLGKNKAIKPNDRILVAFSGSQGSLAVLKLIRNSLEDKNNPKKVTYFPHIVVVDESNLGHDFDLVLEVAKGFNFPVYLVHLCSSFLSDAKPQGIDDYAAPEQEQIQVLADFLAKSPDPTSRSALVKLLRRNLLVRVAEEINCGKLFTGESATSLAVALLSGVASGRGAQVSNETGFCDMRDTVQILRPLREFSAKEVALFNEYNDDKSRAIYHPNDATAQDASNFSIERLTETFVTGLQEGFPSTVPTIFRTGDKFMVEGMHDLVTCAFCRGYIDTVVPKKSCSALEAAQFSKMVSEKGPMGLSNDALMAEKFQLMDVSETRCDENGDECSGQGLCSDGASCKSTAKQFDFKSMLCHSCSQLLSNHETVPDVVVEMAQKAARHQHMRNEIADFLL